MVCSGQATQHDADNGEPEEGGDGSGVTLEVAGQAAVAVDPGEGALDDPALGQDASLRLTISNFHAPVLAMTLAIFGPLRSINGKDRRAVRSRSPAPSRSCTLAGWTATLSRS